LTGTLLHRPEDLSDAIAAASADGAVLVAGGLGVVGMLRGGSDRPGSLVLLSAVPGLAEIADDGRRIRIGSMATHAAIAVDPIISRTLPLVRETFASFGNAQIRSTGTIGGNLAQAIPVYDPPVLLGALGATVEVVGPEGARAIPITELATGPMRTVLTAGEILVAIDIEVPAANVVTRYRRFLPGTQADAPMVSVGVRLAHAGGRVTDLRVIIGGVGRTVEVLGSAADLVLGRPLDELRDCLGELEELVRTSVEPFSDANASADYKREVAAVLAARTLGSCTSEMEGDHA